MKTIPQKSSKTAYAYEQIKAAIMSNEYLPGQILSENKLVTKLGISRTPVREAIKVLEKEGLVQIYKGVGVLVRHITIKEVWDTCELRVLLECYAMQRACERILPWQIKQLVERWEELQTRIRNNGDYSRKQITELDVATHDLVFENAGNDVLGGIHGGMHKKIERFQTLFTKIVDDDANTVQQHIDLLKALQDRDAKQYEVLLKQQVYNPISAIRNNIWE